MRPYFYVEQVTGTPADTLVAFGLAGLVSRLLPEGEDWGLRVSDEGDCYCLSLRDALPSEVVMHQQVGFFPLFKGLDTAKKEADLPQGMREDYVAHQQRNRAFFEGRRQGMDEELLREQGITKPVRDWAAWAVINQMSAVSTYNRLAELWYAHEVCFAELLELLLGLYGTRSNDVVAAEASWKRLAKGYGLPTSSQVPQLQVVNGAMGKGGNVSKANKLSMGGMKGFWLTEYLKLAGLFRVGLPRTVKGSKDRKTYVLRPSKDGLSWRRHGQLFPQFQDALYAETAVKMDIMATLRYCEVFLVQWREGQASRRERRKGLPSSHVAAIEVISYKYLGSAHAAMNMSTLALPLWLPTVETAVQANQFIDMVQEHGRIVRGLEENKGQEYQLLRTYRDFLSAHDLRAFYRFASGYGSVVMSKLARGGYPPQQFTIPNLEVLIMSHDPKLEPILQNEGFQRVAYAIRYSTVMPQFFKSKGQAGPYTIRYGLGTDLLRNASYPEKFAQALSRFVFAYNKENAQVLERYKGNPPVRRKGIRPSDLAELIALVDEYEDSETVANLLVAFGYAREPKDVKKSKD